MGECSELKSGVDFIQKQFTPDDLLNNIRDVLETRRTARA